MIIGMDFGTTNSGMSVFDGEKLSLIPLDPNNNNPTVARTALYITNDRLVHIGRNATDKYYEQNLNRPSKLERVRVGEVELTFAEIGTFIRDVYIDKDVFSPGRLFLSFKMALSSPKYLGTVVGTDYYFLEDIIATYLYVTKKRAETHLKTKLDTIVLGRPVRFSEDESQNEVARERLLQAAFRAGYKTVYLQYEPIAAAYHYESTINTEQNVLIFDFGGGTLDLSIMRLGNPKTRAVLATGGIPIAGDVFDRKIVRKKLPPHFGEGGYYHHTDQRLPVPNSFYDAFSNWQDLLAMQLPDRLESIQMIARTSNQPLKIRALINLITSNYALKMFDLAEKTKRSLSESDQTLIRFDGPGFSVRDIIKRREFEHLIRSDVRAIDKCLDEVIQLAGLNSMQIDAVIRTGGSSQIPAFIDLLNERFGANKVADLDVFSSVTSGLGLIAHEIEQGDITLKAYHAKDYPAGDYLNVVAQGGIPVINISSMKKFIDVKEDQSHNQSEQLAIISLSNRQKLITTLLDANDFEQQIEFSGITLRPPLCLEPMATRNIFMTSEYRLMIKTSQQLADLQIIGSDLETVENFAKDAFGDEMVTGIARFNSLKSSEKIILLTSSGIARIFLTDGFLKELDRSIPYQIPASKGGYPLILIGTHGTHEIIVITSNGRAVCIGVNQLHNHEERLVKVSSDTTIIGAFSLNTPQDIIIITQTGYAKRLSSADIKNTPLNSIGEKIIGRTNPIHAILSQPEKQLFVITTHRIVPTNQDKIPNCGFETTSHKPINLKKDESVLKLTYLP